MHVRPAGETVDVSATVPAKPFNGATVIVDVTAVPEFVDTLVGLAVTEKSGAAVTITVTVVECEREPLVPVTVTV